MEREDVVEIAIAVGAVGLFIVALAVVGAQYGTPNVIGPEGALPLLGTVVLFIVVMAIAGFYLAEKDN